MNLKETLELILNRVHRDKRLPELVLTPGGCVLADHAGEIIPEFAFDMEPARAEKIAAIVDLMAVATKLETGTPAIFVNEGKVLLVHDLTKPPWERVVSETYLRRQEACDVFTSNESLKMSQAAFILWVRQNAEYIENSGDLLQTIRHLKWSQGASSSRSASNATYEQDVIEETTSKFGNVDEWETIAVNFPVLQDPDIQLSFNGRYLLTVDSPNQQFILTRKQGELDRLRLAIEGAVHHMLASTLPAMRIVRGSMDPYEIPVSWPIVDAK